MWGPSIIGFGSYHYVYDSGREGDSPLVGFSPRKAAIVLYLMLGLGRPEALLAKLGKHTRGQGVPVHQEARRRRREGAGAADRGFRRRDAREVPGLTVHRAATPEAPGGRGPAKHPGPKSHAVGAAPT